jgi:hypothetical protein
MTKKSRDQVGHNDGPPLDSVPPLAADVLYGARSIAAFTGLSERQVFYKARALGIRRLGVTLVASKKKLRQVLTGDEAAA